MLARRVGTAHRIASRWAVPTLHRSGNAPLGVARGELSLPGLQRRTSTAAQQAAATAAAAGIVTTQAQTTRPATPQRTALSRFSEPTPTIAPVMVCVVLTG